ncbi:hypothetical protein HPB52_009204 [Rhipicephalus sanguineus]|uniref:Uncharacterized protein n=1 Tax=Rhipicephalus sanguineus TaxID=34632 RepID=A0A9D4PIX5_RHISA|nr:hypothetical protein HPB52_009204 [Rhipicephalus sanguineus]
MTLRELDFDLNISFPYQPSPVKAGTAASASRNKSIHWLGSCTHDCLTEASLMRMLVPKVSSNYTLLSLSTYHIDLFSISYYVVHEVLQRNNALVTRAAHFVIGTRHKHCAAAAELVHFSPGLVTKVQELAGVGEDEAVSRIKSSVKSLSELDDFMCLAGVVKYGVSCHRSEDGDKQLVDLNHDCWLHVRQYLKVDDILDSKEACKFVPRRRQ